MADRDKIPTVQRDLAYQAELLKMAKKTAKTEGAKETWYLLDLIEGNMQGLHIFLGLSHPWDDEVVQNAKERAEASSLENQKTAWREMWANLAQLQ